MSCEATSRLRCNLYVLWINYLLSFLISVFRSHVWRRREYIYKMSGCRDYFAFPSSSTTSVRSPHLQTPELFCFWIYVPYKYTLYNIYFFFCLHCPQKSIFRCFALEAIQGITITDINASARARKKGGKKKQKKKREKKCQLCLRALVFRSPYLIYAFTP